MAFIWARKTEVHVAHLEETFDVAVIGGGIAGLTAALTSARLGRRTVVVTGPSMGGNLLSLERVDGYPGFAEGVPGYELCPIAQEQAGNAGAEFRSSSVQRLERSRDAFSLATDEGALTARSVIVASGATLRRLNVPGEDRLWGKGVSPCASCDAHFLRGQPAAVVGGGDSAMQEALALAPATSKILLLAREDALSGQETYRAQIFAEPKIEVRYGQVVEEILGAETVCGVRVRDSNSGQSQVVHVAGVFVFVGLAPNTGFLPDSIGLSGEGAIVADADLSTSERGLFAAGTVRTAAIGRAVACAGEGTTAALAAHRFLS